MTSGTPNLWKCSLRNLAVGPNSVDSIEDNVRYPEYRSHNATYSTPASLKKSTAMSSNGYVGLSGGSDSS